MTIAELAKKYPAYATLLQSGDVLYVDIQAQTLTHYYARSPLQAYKISTGAKPPSCIAESFGTPLGLHCVAEKHGHDAPIGMVFKSRKPQGKCYWDYPSDAPNLITSRILWLKGLEPGYNSGIDTNLNKPCDTYNRYVYIHGTNREDALGKDNISAACVLMANKDIIDLFDKVSEGCFVFIHA